MALLITHGLRNSGEDPVHTPEGLKQIQRVVASLTLPIGMVVIGTGWRFQQMFKLLYDAGKVGKDVPCRLTPFCGGAEGFDPPSTIILPNSGTCQLKEYIGLGSGFGFDPWQFVNSFQGDTLFLAGGELLTALGVEKPSKGALYGIDHAERVCHLISQG